MAKKKSAPTTPPKPSFSRLVAGQNDTPVLYVNSASMDVSSFDVRFRFGQILGVENDELKVKEIAYVYMSHAHFKAFVELVNKNMATVDKAVSDFRLRQTDDQKTH